MECEDDKIHNAKKFVDKDIKNKMEISKDEDSDLMEESENKDTCEVKENLLNGKKILQDENRDSMENSEDKNIHRVKCKKKHIWNRIKTSQDEDNNLMKKSENINVHKVKYKDKNIRNKIKILKDEKSDLKKKLKNKNKVKYKDEDMENRIKTLQNNNSNMKKMWKNASEAGCRNKDVEEKYCSEATYLAQQKALAERLYQEELRQLYNLHVQLRHTVPPQHKIETRAGSHMPTRKEIEEFEKIMPIKRGLYSFEEDKIIASNWKAFCKLHNWDIEKTKPFLQLRNGNLTYMRNAAERRKFVQFLADGLPNRTLYSVYHRFKNLYENNLQRRYKPEEDEMIIDHLEHNPSLDERCKYTDLAKVLRRTRHSIWRRYRILKKKNKKHEDD